MLNETNNYYSLKRKIFGPLSLFLFILLNQAGTGIKQIKKFKKNKNANNHDIKLQ